MAEKCFRILLDTSHLHIDYSKFVWLNVSSIELNTISDLKNYLLRKINIERDCNLYLKNGLLPDEESINILRDDDVVQIKYKIPNPVKESLKLSANFFEKRNFYESNDSEDIDSFKHELEIATLSYDKNENCFAKEKPKKKKRKNETECPINSENIFDSVEKINKQKETPINSSNFSPISVEQKKNPDGKNKTSDINVNSKRYELEITSSSNGNVDKFVEKKSKKESGKKETELPICSQKFFSNSVETKKQKKLFINSENICSISVEELKKQTESSINFETSYSALIEESQNSKNSHKKKDKNKSPVACNLSVADINFCGAINSYYTLDAEYLSQKQENINKSSKTILFEPEKVSITDGLPSKRKSNQIESPSTVVTDLNSEELNNKLKNKLNRHIKYKEKTNNVDNYVIASSSGSPSTREISLLQNESSTVVTDNNSEEINNKQSKTKRKRHRKRKKTNATIDSFDLINNAASSSENIDNSINRKHIRYLSPAKSQENNCFSNVNEFSNHHSDKIAVKDQSLDYPKVSTPAQLNISSTPNLQFPVMISKKSKLSCNENESTTENKALQGDKEKQLHEHLPDLTNLLVGARIAYKTLELDESYSPVASDYREGIVEKIDPNTKEIIIRFDNEIILPAKTGKFENLGKDEEPEPTVKTYDVLKLCDLIEPKILNSLPK